MAKIDVASLTPTLATADFKALEPLLLQLEEALTLRTYLDGYGSELSALDKDVWTALKGNKFAMGTVRKAAFANVTRWFTYLEATHPELKPAAPVAKKEKSGANYNIGLTNTEAGVVTRFPPEPS